MRPLVVLLCVVAMSAGCHRRRVISQARASSAPQRAPEDGDEERKPGQPGNKRWKDTGVYVDGRPVGVLSFGELPITLSPVWVKDKVSAEIEPGSKSPGWRWIKERQYRFSDYLKSIGVDVRKVREIHVMGPRFSETIIASGKELRTRGDGFRFRFGGIVNGKALPVVPENFGNGRTPDKISSVMVYVNREPPKLVWNVGLELDGRAITDVPYHGEPLRGGVRVYSDDLLQLVIKRPLLRQSTPVENGRYSLFKILDEQGIDVSKAVEAWVVRNEKRQEKLSRAEIENMTFVMAEKGKNEIHLGEQKIAANAILFHSRPVRPDRIPAILPDEDF